jgi:hypothetical protein
MMFVFENTNRGLDEGEMVGGDDVSLHFDAGPSLFVWLLQGFLEFGTYQLPTSEVPSLAVASCLKARSEPSIHQRSTQSKPPINVSFPHSPSFVILYVLDCPLPLAAQFGPR